MVLQRIWNAREPRQRPWVGWRGLWEAPVEDCGHVAGRAEVASGGGCQHVAEWVFTGFGREAEQVGSQGWPGGFGGESGDVLVGLVELCDGLGSDKLFGCDVEAVGVALDLVCPAFSGRLNLCYFMLPAARLNIRCGPRAGSGNLTLSGVGVDYRRFQYSGQYRVLLYSGSDKRCGAPAHS
jgi:hypothetical protein